MITNERGIALLVSLDDLLVLHQALAEYVIFGGQLNEHTPTIVKDQAREMLTIVSDALISELTDAGNLVQCEAVRTLTNSTLKLDVLKGSWGRGGGEATVT